MTSPSEEVCETCNGRRFITISYGGDGYGNRCAALADADDQPCPDCNPNGEGVAP